MNEWSCEECPNCRAKNWLWESSDGNFDNDSYVCWSCVMEIQIFDGKHHTDYQPHIDGSSQWDGQQWGNQIDGAKNPS